MSFCHISFFGPGHRPRAVGKRQPGIGAGRPQRRGVTFNTRRRLPAKPRRRVTTIEWCGCAGQSWRRIAKFIGRGCTTDGRGGRRRGSAGLFEPDNDRDRRRFEHHRHDWIRGALDGHRSAVLSACLRMPPGPASRSCGQSLGPPTPRRKAAWDRARHIARAE